MPIASLDSRIRRIERVVADERGQIIAYEVANDFLDLWYRAQESGAPLPGHFDFIDCLHRQQQFSFPGVDNAIRYVERCAQEHNAPIRAEIVHALRQIHHISYATLPTEWLDL